ncbi:hypothetical protein AMTR_s00048p00093900 [Amborella trichopoda]|uniref:Survival Motor Neuron Gemin2-binding domain-containing protein n=1 Tax=Amborella trichopoda TaxID=13333 RepID=U5CQS9_AMBTC|nr:hypothetical protein AMTR_s00048p00093900 [Amborella trichopoda]
MGKETAIWDDSVLIQAFDDAMNKFKVMHNGQRISTNAKEAVSDGMKNKEADIDEIERLNNKRIAICKEEKKRKSDA